jgi:hypothetical protein
MNMKDKISIHFKPTGVEGYDDTPKGAESFKKSFKDTLNIHFDENHILDSRERRELLGAFFDTMTYDESDDVSGEPIERDVFNSVSGHGTVPDGYAYTASLEITMNIQDISKLAALGLGTDEVKEIIAYAVEDADMMALESVEFPPLVQQVLDENLNKRERDVGEKYIAMPNEMPDILTPQSLEGLPQFAYRESLFITTPKDVFGWPVYDGNPSDLLDPEKWHVQQVKDALPTIKGASVAVRSDRAESKPYLPFSYVLNGHNKSYEFSYLNSMIKAISAHRDNPRIMEMAGVNLQTLVPSGADQLLVARNIGLHLRSKGKNNDLLGNVFKSEMGNNVSVDGLVSKFEKEPAKYFAHVVSIIACGVDDVSKAMEKSINNAIETNQPSNDELSQKNNRN